MGDTGADDGADIADWARCVRVGVTGHRLARLDVSSLTGLKQGIKAALRAMQAAAPGGAPPCLISNLADGADSIAADAALALGWRLDAVLPLPREAIAEDFADRAPLDAQLARARAVFELPDSDNEAKRIDAYERAGRVMLSQSDLVLAVWDGEPARGRGGAGQIVAEAIARGIPVLHLHPDAPETPTLLGDGLDDDERDGRNLDSLSRAGLERLPALMARLVERDPDPLGDVLLAELQGVRRLRGWRPAMAWPLLLALFGVRGLRWADFARPAVPGAPPPASGRAERAQQRLRLWFDRADAAAILAARTFRSTYVTSYALGALAVLLALSTLALPAAVKPFVAAAELATLSAILVIIRAGRRAHSHHRWLDQRHLAERLRGLMILHRLGELSLRRGPVEGGWVPWAMRAAGRMAGLPDARVDAAYLGGVKAELMALLDDQIAYLRADATRMHKLEHRLHRLGGILFAISALVCVGVVGLQFASLAMGWKLYGPVKEAVGVGSTIAAAGLPACGAALYGIRMQGDFAGVAERSAALAARLTGLRQATVADPPDFDVLVRRTRRVSELLTADLATWLHAYRARPLTLPG